MTKEYCYRISWTCSDAGCDGFGETGRPLSTDQHSKAVLQANAEVQKCPKCQSLITPTEYVEVSYDTYMENGIKKYTNANEVVL